MGTPYFLTFFLYLILAALAVLDTSLVNWRVLSPLPNLRWLTVHLVVLGALTQFIFGALPILAAARSRRPKPGVNWETWLTLNIGTITLLLAVPGMNFTLITLGGTLVFLAVLLLARQLVNLRPDSGGQGQPGKKPFWTKLRDSGSLKFYLASLAFLLTGILVGTGLWQGWSRPLQIAIPKEVHVHANLWGFTALIFAGFLLDLAPAVTGRKFPWPRWVGPAFWFMTLGALSLVLGPWLNVDILQVIGLALHTAGSVILVAGTFWPVRKQMRSWKPAVWRILFSYLWFFLAVVVAPLVVAQSGVGTEVAGSGGPILVFGWILQFAAAVIPAFLQNTTRARLPESTRRSLLSLILINLGSLIYWVSLFTAAYRGPLRGFAFLVWLLSLFPLLLQTAAIVKSAYRLIWQETGGSAS